MNQQSSTDSQSGFDSILATLIEEAEQGVIDIPQWTAKYPEHADQIRSFFANRGKVDAVVGPRGVVDTEAPTISFTGAESIGQRIRYFGDYEILQEIARGGMGVVYQAKQASLNRVVALKMILTGNLASTSDIQRFRAEAEAAANLDHPNIVPIYEVGEFESQQYFSMKLIEGGNLSQACRQRPPLESTRDQQRWVATTLSKVARAVHHAHQRGILHRDLKPGNILIDTAGEPHVTDFGLAKKVEGGSDLTNTGAIVGTPTYMAPEQARCEKGLSTAADVYSLGAILYELLTGQTPFKGATPLDTILEVLEKEPVRPSLVYPQIDRDLETITLKCLDKTPSNRYRSAEALADELERWLAGDPILARPVGKIERTWKWMRRNPIVSSLLTASIVLTLGILIALAGLLYFARLQSTEAAQRLEEAHQAAARESSLKGEAVEAQKRAERATDTERLLRNQTEGLLYANRISLAHQYWKADNLTRTLSMLEETPAERRGWEWNYLQRVSHGERLRLPGNGQFTTQLSADRSGTRLATIADTGFAGVVVWDLKTRQKLFELDLSAQRQVARAAISPDGKLLAVGERTGEVTVWSIDDKKLIKSLGKMPARILYLSFLQDGKVFASTGSFSASGVSIWEIESGKAVKLPDMYKRVLAVLPDGKQLLCLKRKTGFVTDSRLENLLVSCDATTGEERHQFGFMNCLSFTPDGKRMALAGYAKNSDDKPLAVLQVVDLTTQQILFSQQQEGTFGDVEISPDGKCLASLPFMSVPITLWDVASGKKLRDLRGHTQMLNSALFLDQERLVSCSWDNTVRVWNIHDEVEFDTHGSPSIQVVSHAAFHPLKNQVAVVQGDNVGRGLLGQMLSGPAPDVVVTIVDSHTGQELQKLVGHKNGARMVAYSANGERLISGGRDGLAIVWDSATGRKLAEVSHPGWITKVVLSPDGKWAASSFESDSLKQGRKEQRYIPDLPDEVRIWDASTGVVKCVVNHPKRLFYSVAFTPDSQQLMTSNSDEVQFWNVMDGSKLRSFKTTDKPACFTPNGEYIVATSAGTLKLLKLADFSLAGQLKGATHSGRGGIAIHPAGSRLAVSSGSKVILYDLHSCEELLTLSLENSRRPNASIVNLSFTPDGTALRGFCYDGTGIIWKTK